MTKKRSRPPWMVKSILRCRKWEIKKWENKRLIINRFRLGWEMKPRRSTISTTKNISIEAKSWPCGRESTKYRNSNAKWNTTLESPSMTTRSSKLWARLSIILRPCKTEKGRCSLLLQMLRLNMQLQSSFSTCSPQWQEEPKLDSSLLSPLFSSLELSLSLLFLRKLLFIKITKSLRERQKKRELRKLLMAQATSSDSNSASLRQIQPPKNTKNPPQQGFRAMDQHRSRMRKDPQLTLNRVSSSRLSSPGRIEKSPKIKWAA